MTPFRSVIEITRSNGSYSHVPVVLQALEVVLSRFRLSYVREWVPKASAVLVSRPRESYPLVVTEPPG